MEIRRNTKTRENMLFKDLKCGDTFILEKCKNEKDPNIYMKTDDIISSHYLNASTPFNAVLLSHGITNKFSENTLVIKISCHLVVE